MIKQEKLKKFREEENKDMDNDKKKKDFKWVYNFINEWHWYNIFSLKFITSESLNWLIGITIKWIWKGNI